eukprot:evm.model.scf_318.6 EVM.evm.TU.scf_318.6   scf_318:28602-32904(+)
MAAPSKGRTCAEASLELLLIETVRRYSVEKLGPPAASTLEAIGFRVGRQLAERYTRDRPRLGDSLEVIKFICKEFWQSLFKKQIDNLKTNHRGVYVLQDNHFRYLQHVSLQTSAPRSSHSRQAAAALAADYLCIPSGMIKGALVHLGVSCTVQADVMQLPACAFTIKVQQ